MSKETDDREILKSMIYRAKQDINHSCDGPMTPLVAMNRACSLAKANIYSIDVCAEALEEVLLEYDWLVEDYTAVKGVYPS